MGGVTTNTTDTSAPKDSVEIGTNHEYKIYRVFCWTKTTVVSGAKLTSKESMHACALPLHRD